MNQIEILNRTRVVTGEVILLHPYLFEAQKYKNSSVAKYRTTIIIPKTETETIEKINKAIDEAIIQGKYKFGNEIPERSSLILPLKDGNDSESLDPVYYNSYFINASSDFPPKVVNKDNLPYLDKIIVPNYSYARIAIMFQAFNINGNKRISCSFNNVKLLDKRFDVSKYLPTPEEDFK